MTIDEVIEHCKRTVEFESKYIMKSIRGGGKVEYSKRYLEHKLVAEWLEEYKKLKSIDEDLRLKYCYEDLSDADNLGYLRGYNEAIDDLTNKLTSDEFQKYRVRWDKLSKSIDTVSSEVKDIHTTTDKISKKFESISSVDIESLDYKE